MAAEQQQLNQESENETRVEDFPVHRASTAECFWGASRHLIGEKARFADPQSNAECLQAEAYGGVLCPVGIY